MFHRNAMQAHNEARREGKRPSVIGVLAGSSKRVLLIERRSRDFATYPEVPAGWPNRATRRAVKHGRDSRLSAPWKQALQLMPKLRPEIKAL